MLLGTRSQMTEDGWNPYFFNDIQLADLYKIVLHMWNLQKARRVQVHEMLEGTLAILTLSHYDLLMLVGPLLRTPEGKSAPLDAATAWRASIAAGQVRPGAPILIVETDTGIVLQAFEMPERRTHMTTLLDEWKSRCP